MNVESDDEPSNEGDYGDVSCTACDKVIAAGESVSCNGCQVFLHKPSEEHPNCSVEKDDVFLCDIECVG